MFIVILDHENMGVDTQFLWLLFTTKKLLKKIRFFDNGGTNLQGCHEDNPTKFLQGPHGKPNPPKTLYFREFIKPWVAFGATTGLIRYIHYVTCQSLDYAYGLLTLVWLPCLGRIRYAFLWEMVFLMDIGIMGFRVWYICNDRTMYIYLYGPHWWG